MANKTVWRRLLPAAAAVALSGCVSVRNADGLVPPPALCSSVTGTVGVPRGPVEMDKLKEGRTSVAVHLHEWFFTGASASLLEMSLREAARKGGLKEVRYADYEQLSILGFVTIFSLVAYGD